MEEKNKNIVQTIKIPYKKIANFVFSAFSRVN